MARSVSEEREGATWWWRNVADTAVAEVRSGSPVEVTVVACGPGVIAPGGHLTSVVFSHTQSPRLVMRKHQTDPN